MFWKEVKWVRKGEHAREEMVKDVNGQILHNGIQVRRRLAEYLLMLNNVKHHETLVRHQERLMKHCETLTKYRETWLIKHSQNIVKHSQNIVKHLRLKWQPPSALWSWHLMRDIGIGIVLGTKFPVDLVIAVLVKLHWWVTELLIIAIWVFSSDLGPDNQ